MKTRLYFIIFGLGVLGVFGVLGSGCGDASCETVCASRNECEDIPKTADCKTSCDADIKAAGEADCTEEHEAWLSCQNTADVCSTAETFCSAQNAAYLNCLSDACEEDPSTCGGS